MGSKQVFRTVVVAGEPDIACICAEMAERPKQSKTQSKRRAEANDAAQRFGEQCPKCGSDDVRMVEPFNSVHADGIYCSQCERHSFPDES
jgi:hypothetical protein